MIKKLLMCLLIFQLLSCSQSKKKNADILINKLKCDTSITALSDSSFFTNRIACMEESNDRIFLTDYSAGQIIVLNQDLSLKSKIGTRGNGPGEIIGAANFCIDNNRISVINEGRNAIEEFMDGRYSKTIDFPQKSRLTNCTRFFYYNKLFYHSVISKDAPVATFDENSTLQNKICQYTTWDSDRLLMHSTRHLLKADKSFYVLGQALPIFQEYSFEGKLLREYNLLNIPEINSFMKKYKEQVQVPESYSVLVQDAYIDNKRVYLLLCSDHENYSCNKILVFDTSSKIKHIGTFELEGKVYESFCVKNQRLIAFNLQKSSIDVYWLPSFKD